MDTDENDDEELHCNICFEPWTNAGSHRITSLKCGKLAEGSLGLGVCVNLFSFFRTFFWPFLY